jgi:hypothetical protein
MQEKREQATWGLLSRERENSRPLASLRNVCARSPETQKQGLRV